MARSRRFARGFVLASLAVALPVSAPHAATGQAPAQKPSKPSCVVSDVTDPNASAVTTTFPATLNESRRRHLFADLAKAVDQARRDTAREYPTRDSSSLSLSGPSDGSKSGRYNEAQRLTLRAAEIKHVAGVLRAEGLSCTDARGVYREGRAKKWPAGQATPS